MQADFGLIGLAVMGENLTLNIIEHGYTTVVFNRTLSKVDEFVNTSNKGDKLIGAHSIQEFVSLLKKPRKIMLMVKAGPPVDEFIEQLIPFLEPGDIIIDGGNSNYLDTNRRTNYLESKNFLFIGTGISGGEEGARYGPSIMPGGSKKAWPLVKDLLQAISAKVEGNIPCCDWVGEGGAGHYVKMVHNGIEYGDMELIVEAYFIMRKALQMTPEEISAIFAQWNKGRLNSYLIEITRDILKVKDTDNIPLIDKILDIAGQKGTGKWTVISAAELGIPVTLIAESVFQRCLSARKVERVQASQIFKDEHLQVKLDSSAKKKILDDIEQALYASKIISYSQGFMLMQAAALEYHWNLNYGGIALMWRGGCIIRSIFLGKIKDAYDENPHLSSLLIDPYFKNEIYTCQDAWRRTVIFGLQNGIPVPSFAAALTYFDGFKSGQLPANLIQAQRDYFGAHGYERIDGPQGKLYHTDWNVKTH